MSKKYKVIDQPVEINGKKYFVDDVVDESSFLPELANDDPEAEKVSEAQSLLATGHIELIK